MAKTFGSNHGTQLSRPLKEEVAPRPATLYMLGDAPEGGSAHTEGDLTAAQANACHPNLRPYLLASSPDPLWLVNPSNFLV